MHIYILIFEYTYYKNCWYIIFQNDAICYWIKCNQKNYINNILRWGRRNFKYYVKDNFRLIYDNTEVFLPKILDISYLVLHFNYEDFNTDNENDINTRLIEHIDPDNEDNTQLINVLRDN